MEPLNAISTFQNISYAQSALKFPLIFVFNLSPFFAKNLASKGSRTISKTMPLEVAPAAIQTIAAAAPKIFFFDEAMLEGTKRCARSLQRNSS